MAVLMALSLTSRSAARRLRQRPEIISEGVLMSPDNSQNVISSRPDNSHKLKFSPRHLFGDSHKMNVSDYPHAEIGARLRRFRETKCMSIKDFAESNSWSPTQLTNWETGHRRITVDAAAKLRSRYSLSLDWIYLGDESALPQNVANALSSRPSDRS